MPNPNGLLNRVASSRPAFARISADELMSGFAGRHDPDVDVAIDSGDVIKPFATDDLLIAVVGALERGDLVAESRMDHASLEELVRRRTGELDDSQTDTVERLSRAVDSPDPTTGIHLERMSGPVYGLAIELGWASVDAEALGLANVRHDVGKVGIPDDILLTRATLSSEERALVEKHVDTGHGILADADSGLLRLADGVASTHHERYDGSGYTHGLVGEEISLASRVADVFDPPTSDRPHRAARPESDAVAPIHADPELDADENVVNAQTTILQADPSPDPALSA